MDNVSLYQRGFIGKGQINPNTGRVARQELLIAQNTYQLIDRDPGNDLPFNKDVDRLYVKMMHNDPHIHTFEFRSEIIKVALTAFGVKDPEMWYHLQVRGPAFGDMHSRFIDDCIHFIEHGKRDMALSTWDSLIDIVDLGKERMPQSKAAQEFFLGRNRAGRHSLNAFIQDWVSQRNGISDLLYSLYILFGSKEKLQMNQ